MNTGFLRKSMRFNDVENFLRKREHLLITEGQDNSKLLA